jgi:hypothetical protein
VWVGAGNTPGDGITRNLWGTANPGCVNATTGVQQACNAANTTVTAPWGVPLNWGTIIAIRDTVCDPSFTRTLSDGTTAAGEPNLACGRFNVPLGNGLPDWQFAVSQNFQWRRLSVYALLQGVMGRDVWNETRHWSHLDFITNDTDQRSATVETAKPIGYYWRASPPQSTGYGGFYDFLAQNSHFVEDASYAKLRELMVSYNVGPVGGVGNWTVSVVGRNLFTISNYQGFDPEVGLTGGTASSSAINAIDAFVFPNLRSLTFAVSTSF